MLPRYIKQPWLREGRYCELHEQHLLREHESDFAVCVGARKIA